MRRALLLVFAPLVASLAFATACTEETLIVAVVPVEDDAGHPITPPPRCQRNADCPREAFCKKQSCDAPAGTCELFPSVCEDTERAVCGCNRVTYFNDCLRRADGVAASTEGPCPYEGSLECGGEANVPCPDGAYCGRLFGFGSVTCSPLNDGRGRCWVLPLHCPPPTTSDRWMRCGPGSCVDTCTAIRDEGIHRRADRCP
jgi:hypothetical protein